MRRRIRSLSQMNSMDAPPETLPVERDEALGHSPFGDYT